MGSIEIKQEIEKAIDKAEDCYDYRVAAESIVKDLGDENWAKEVYNKAIDKAGTSNNYLSIAESIIENLGDKDWGKELYSKGLDKAETSNDYTLVGGDIIYLLKDKQWGRKIYLKALDKAANAKDFRNIAARVSYDLEDKDWAVEILREGDDPYQIAPLSGPFGYMRSGDGCVVYLSNSEPDIFVRIKQVTDLVYDTIVEYDGEEVVDFAEYDPSYIASELYDDCSILDATEMMEGSPLSDEEKFESLINKDILSKGIPLIFIDADNKTISQIENIDELHKIIMRHNDNLTIHVREYDHVYDY